MKTKITNYIRAGYPGLYIVSPEDQRVEAEIKAIAESLKFDLFFWSAVDGLFNTRTGAQNSVLDPLEALQAVEDQKEKSITLLKDFHLHLADPNPILISKLNRCSPCRKPRIKRSSCLAAGCAFLRNWKGKSL